MANNPYDQFDKVSSTVSDLGAAFGIGSNQLLRMAGDLYGLAADDMDNAVSRQAAENIEYLQKRKSPELVEAERARKKATDLEEDELSKALTFFRETAKNPLLAATASAESVPSLVGAGGAGAATRVAAGKLLARKGVEKAAEQATKAGVAAAVGTGAAMQGTSAAGEQYRTLVELLNKMPDEQAAQLPQIKRLMEEKEASLPEAKAALALDLARSTGILSGAASVATQMVPGGRAIEKTLVGGPAKRVLSRAAGAVKGAAGEALQEAAEEGSGTIIQNIMAEPVEPGREITKGLGESVAAATIGAAPLGAAAGAAGAGGATQSPQPAPEVETTAGKSEETPASAATRERLTEQPRVDLTRSEEMSPEEFWASVNVRHANLMGGQPSPEDVQVAGGVAPAGADIDPEKSKQALDMGSQALASWRESNPSAPENIVLIYDPEMLHNGYGVQGAYNRNNGGILINTAFVTPERIGAIVNHEWAHATLATAEGQQALAKFAEDALKRVNLGGLQNRYGKKDPIVLLEEWIAENQEQAPSVIRDIVARIREWLAQFNIVDLNDGEVADIMLRTLRELESNKVQPDIDVTGIEAEGQTPETAYSLAQTKTPEFKEWFGDSKVVDAEGKPLVVYHGSPKAGFTIFDESARETQKGRDIVGYYFTNSPAGAETYSNTRREAKLGEPEHPGNYPVFLSMKNPLEVDFGGNVEPGVQGDWAGTYKIDGETFQGGIDDAARSAKEMGYDGLIARNIMDEGQYGQGYGWGDTTYVVFNPEQVTSASGNVGTYGQRPVTEEEAARTGLTAEQANKAQAEGDIRFSLSEQPIAKGRDTVLARAAQGVKAGEVTPKEYNRMVNKRMPLEPFEEVPTPATDDEVLLGLGDLMAGNRRKRDLKVNPEDIEGQQVEARLDIPAYESKNVWVVTLHQPREKEGAAGTVLAYTPTAVLQNVTFSVNETAALNVAGGKRKSSFATMNGEYVPMTARSAYEMANEAKDSGDWVEVGMNPIRHSYFYDKSDQRPVVSAEEVIQVGGMVLARGVEYGEKGDYKYSLQNPERPASGIMASPSITDIDYGRAKRNLTSANQARFKSQVTDYAPEATVYDAVGDWADGAENSVAAIFEGSRSTEELEELAAKAGLAGDQKAVLWWTTDPKGKDAIHRVIWPKGVSMDDARQAMIDVGLENRTLIQTPDGIQGFVFDQGQQNINKIEELHEHSTEPALESESATGDFLGSWTSRTEGRRAYRRVLGSTPQSEAGDGGEGDRVERAGGEPEADFRFSLTPAKAVQDEQLKLTTTSGDLQADAEGFIPQYITKNNGLPTVVGGKNKTVKVPFISFNEYANLSFKSRAKDPELAGKQVTLAQAHIPVIQNSYAGLDTATYREPDIAKATEMVVDDMADNLLFLHDLATEVFGGDVVTRMSKWYDGARVIAEDFAKKYNISVEQSAAVLACLSPQKHWFANVSLAENVMDVLRNHQDTVFDAAVEKSARAAIKKSTGTLKSKRQLYEVIRGIAGKKLSELSDPDEVAVFTRFLSEHIHPKKAYIVTPEGRLTPGSSVAVAWSGIPITKNAIAAFLDDAVSNLTVALGGGHKVRNFYGNIIDPLSALFYTSDTHNVAASLLIPVGGTNFEVSHNFGGNPSKARDVEGAPLAAEDAGPKLPIIGTTISGLQGTYALYVEAGRRAAEKRNVLPRQMQSITWEMVRILFPDDSKTEELMTDIKNLHAEVRSGETTLAEVRQKIVEKMGGKDQIRARPPEWLNQ